MKEIDIPRLTSELIARCQEDTKKIKEMLEQRLAQGVFVDITLFEWIEKNSPSNLAYYFGNGDRKSPGKKIHGIVNEIDRNGRYLRIEIYGDTTQNERVDIFGSAIHSFKVDTRDSYSQDETERIEKEHATWGKNVGD